MATRKRQTLDIWVRDAMAEEVDGRKLSMIVLAHMVGSQPKEIHSIKLASGKIPSPEEIADILRRRAEHFSQDLSGTQMFQLMAFYGKTEPERYQPFSVAPYIDPSNISPSEPATDSGKLAQSMRQGEMQFQAMMRQTIALSEAQSTFMTMQAKILESVLAENRMMSVQMRELLMETALNTQKYEMERLGYIRTSEERKKWLSMLPLLTNTLLGKDVYPQSAADTVLVEQLVENIDENTIALLGNFVKPELMGILMTRFTEIKRKKNLELKAANAAMVPISGINPEDDAVGGGKKPEGEDE